MKKINLKTIGLTLVFCFILIYSLLLLELIICYVSGEAVCHYSLLPVTLETIIILSICVLTGIFVFITLKL